jgi:hypothetical protein
MKPACINCKHWKVGNYGSWARDPKTAMEMDCDRVKEFLSFEMHDPPYAGGSTVEAISTSPSFMCIAWQSLDNQETDSEED